MIPRQEGDANHNVIPDDLTNYKVVDPGDLVINKMKAWQGSLGVATVHGIVSPAYFVFSLQEIGERYAHALLRSRPYIGAFAAASDGIRIDQWDLSMVGMKAITALIPTRLEQAGIIRFLDYVDSRIQRFTAEKEQLIGLLDEKRQATIYRAATRGLDSGASLKPSGVDWIGHMPKHWRVKELRHLGRIQGGLTPSMDRSDYWGGSIPWVSPKDMKRPKIDGSIDSVTSAALSGTGLRLIPPGSVLMVVRGMILARRVPVAVTSTEVTVNQDMKAIVPNSDIDGPFLAGALSAAQIPLMQMIDEAGHGTRRLPTDRWRRLSLPVPPVDEQRAIAAEIDLATDLVERTRKCGMHQITLLREYRTHLISGVVTGKLDVRTAAAKLPDDPYAGDPALDERLEEVAAG